MNFCSTSEIAFLFLDFSYKVHRTLENIFEYVSQNQNNYQLLMFVFQLQYHSVDFDDISIAEINRSFCF